MLYLLVQVNEGVKCIILERIMSIESTCKFFELFDLTTLGQYDNREFCLASNTNLDTLVSIQDKPDAFSILMANSRQPLLPRHCNEPQQVGWTGGLYETIGKVFVNRIATALWYIDLHLSTLSARSYHLLALFAQLKTY
ncbi:6596_t:CDS:2 [Scutellospora calospora]|uniref:6596_t:CDS:1 n=1 Tax=Scutellospora calospora TaxID=85575 RepID=A0ACA9N661_9GLOM|nr:6596_t:CDS:2 [Scutellospora calospora]